MRFLCHISTMDKRNAAERPHEDRMDIVRYPQPNIAIRRPGHCTGTMRQPCDRRAGAVRPFYDFSSNDHLKSCGRLTITSRPPHGGRTMLLRRVYGLRAYDFYFRIYFRAIHNRRGHSDRTAPGKPYDIIRRPYGNGDIGIIAASFGRRGINVN